MISSIGCIIENWWRSSFVPFFLKVYHFIIMPGGGHNELCVCAQKCMSREQELRPVLIIIRQIKMLRHIEIKRLITSMSNSKSYLSLPFGFWTHVFVFLQFLCKALVSDRDILFRFYWAFNLNKRKGEGKSDSSLQLESSTRIPKV